MRVTNDNQKLAMESQQRTEKEEEKFEGKTIVVGVRMDLESKELLTWALVKVATAGDRVIALHVVPATGADGNPSSFLALVKAFGSVLAVYEGFCNLKQIDLKMKVCRGSAVRKVLVREVSACSAAKIILGVNRTGRTIGYSSTSVAKYCAKKLPPDCSVMAVSNGKVVYHKEAASSTTSSKAIVPGKAVDHGKPACFMALARQVSSKHLRSLKSKARKSNPSRKLMHGANVTVAVGLNCDIIGANRSSSQVCPTKTEQSSEETKEDESLAIVPVLKAEDPSTLMHVAVTELPAVKHGWPLLQKTFLSHRKASSSERSKGSVVQWAMRLPSRYSLAIHPDQKTIKAEAYAKVSYNNGSNTIVPVDSYLSSTSVKINEVSEISEELASLPEKYSSTCRVFTYMELMQATSNFSPVNLIGQGGSSCVYKGYLSDGKELAVKIMKNSEDAVKEFVQEIEIITSLHHKNIVSLFGFCFENNNLLLVYDFLSRGNLEDNLHGEEEKRETLSCSERCKVAVCVAEALEYLHSGGSGQPVIHRDVKSSNILLSDDFEPQLSDFGLATYASSTSQTTSFDVAGTFGYLAPEYFMYGKVTEKLDVYAFGVVLLELITGRKAILTGGSKGQESLLLWAKPILQSGKVTEVVDPCLGGAYNHDEMERMVLAASLCIRHSPHSRPRIALVLKLLQGDDGVLKWARSQANASEELDGFDDEVPCLDSNIQSHINLALLDIEDDSTSVSSVEPTVDFITANTTLDDYLKGQWSRSSSFD